MFVEHRFRAHEHTELQPQHLSHPKPEASPAYHSLSNHPGSFGKYCFRWSARTIPFSSTNASFASRLPFHTGREEITAGTSRSISPSSPFSCARMLSCASASEKTAASASQGPNGSSLVTRISGCAAVTESLTSLHRASFVDRPSGHSTQAIRKGITISEPGLRASNIAYRRLRSRRLCTKPRHCALYRSGIAPERGYRS